MYFSKPTFANLLTIVISASLPASTVFALPGSSNICHNSWKVSIQNSIKSLGHEGVSACQLVLYGEQKNPEPPKPKTVTKSTTVTTTRTTTRTDATKGITVTQTVGGTAQVTIVDQTISPVETAEITVTEFDPTTETLTATETAFVTNTVTTLVPRPINKRSDIEALAAFDERSDNGVVFGQVINSPSELEKRGSNPSNPYYSKLPKKLRDYALSELQTACRCLNINPPPKKQCATPAPITKTNVITKTTTRTILATRTTTDTKLITVTAQTNTVFVTTTLPVLTATVPKTITLPTTITTTVTATATVVETASVTGTPDRCDITYYGRAGAGNGAGNRVEGNTSAKSARECCESCYQRLNCVASVYAGICQLLVAVAGDGGEVTDMCPLGTKNYSFGTTSGLIVAGPCGY